MSIVGLIIVALEVVGAVVCLGIIIYLAVRRVGEKRGENFEDRDN